MKTMLKRILAALLVVVMLSGLVPFEIIKGFCFNASAVTGIPSYSVSFNGQNGNTNVGFFYEDSFFNESSNTGVINQNLALSSAALASGTYNKKAIKQVLEDMGYTVLAQENYSDSATKNNFDRVAFTLAKKKLKSSNFTVYAIFIRGTAMNNEWYSNFDIGRYGTGHKGFLNAAKEVVKYIEDNRIIDTPKENTKLWFTGHSRGAAVANIIAGEWSLGSGTYASRENIYAYTYACPNVNFSGNIYGLKNIYNFNNPCDLVTELPLEKWGFCRYGITISMPTSGDLYEKLKSWFTYLTGDPEFQGNADLSTALKAMYNWVSNTAWYYDKGLLNYSAKDMFFDIAYLLINSNSPNAKWYARVAELIGKTLLSGFQGSHYIVGFFVDAGVISKKFHHGHCQETYIAWMNSAYTYSLSPEALNAIKTLINGNESVSEKTQNIIKDTTVPPKAPSPKPSHAPINYKKGLYKTTATEGLNFREKAGTSYKSYGLIPYGTELAVTEVSNGWGKTEYNGKIGWVYLYYTKYLGEIYKPDAPKLKLDTTKEIGMGESIKVSWNSVTGAKKYNVVIKNVTDSKTVKNFSGITETSIVYIPSEAGTYQVSAFAENALYRSSTATLSQNITVHPDVTVTFYVNDNEGNAFEYQKNTLTWGHSLATMPESPVKKGKAFSGWCKDGETTFASFDSLKEDMDVYATYKSSKYKVRFLDSSGNPISVTLPSGQIVTSQTIEYGSSAVAPTDFSFVSDGRVFVGWNKSFDSIIENTDITAVTDSEDYDLPVEVVDVSATRYEYGYEVYCTVKNLTNANTQGRIIVALKTDEGKLITTTESAAYYILASDDVDENGKQIFNSERIKVVVPNYDSELESNVTATKAEVYAVENFKSTVPVSSCVGVSIEDRNPWTEWSEKQETGYTEETTETMEQYRSREMQYKTTTSKSEKDELLADDWIEYQNATSQKVYGSWSRTKPAEQENRVIEKDDVAAVTKTTYWYKRYKYYNTSAKAYYYSYGSTWATDKGYKGTWEFTSSDKELSVIGEEDGHTKYKGTWYRADCNTKQGTDHIKYKVTTTVTAAYTKYRAVDTVYTYYLNKWGDYSSWTTTPIAENPDKIDVDKRTLYRYRKDDLVRVEDNSGVIRKDFISDNVGVEFAGKQATLFIYKVNEASDWTTEYLAQTVINSDGSYSFKPYKLREEPTETTGDFTVTLGISGSDSAKYLGKIEAPDPEYIVTYYDDITGEKIAISSEKVDNYNYYYKRYRYYNTNSQSYLYSYNSIWAANNGYNGTWMYKSTTEPLAIINSVDGVAVYEGDWYRADCNLTEGTQYTTYKEYIGTSTVYTYEQTVVEHGDAMPPDPPIHEGYIFSHWDMRSTDIIGHTDINAIYVPINYTVSFIDWENQYYDSKTYQYGDLVDLPLLEDTSEKNALGWDLATNNENITVKSNMVLTAKYEPKTFSVEFFDENFNTIGESQIVEYGESPIAPEIDSTEKKMLLGWQNGEEIIYDVEMLSVTENAYLSPVFVFENTTDTPVADLETGTYNSTKSVSLSCSTEKAVIYYTTDGTDPAVSKTAIEYTEPIEISDTCQLRFIASAFNMNVSDEVSEWYVINDGSENDKFILKLLKGNNGKAIYIGTVDSGSKLKCDLIPNYEGLNFVGAYRTITMTENTVLDMNIEYSDAWDFSTNIVTSDTTLYLDYDTNRYTVEFVDYDGMVLDTKTVKYGENAFAPEVHSREGYVFTGWDTDAYTDVTENLTVNAVYVPEDEYVTIELTRSSYTMMSGNSYTLKALTGGNVENPEIVWASSDENVAVVDDNGVVTATGKGTAEIYAIIADNGETSICKINVVSNPSDEISIVGGSHLGFDDYRYIRGFTVTTDEETQEHYAETVAEVRSQLLNNDLEFSDINGNILADDDYVGTGTIIRLKNGEDLMDAVTVVVSGDMDGDGYVTNRDASRISRYLVDKESPTEAQLFAMDVNGDGYVNNRDAAVISRYLVGKEAL